VRSPKLPAANDSRRVYAPHGIRTGVLLKPSRAYSPLGSGEYALLGFNKLLYNDTVVMTSHLVDAVRGVPEPG